MDKEKLLKKFIAKMAFGHIAVCSIIFVWIFSYEYDFIDFGQFCKYGLTLFCVTVLFVIVHQVVFGEKEKKEKLAIMPLIISIHDTEEKLKKQRILFFVLYFISFLIGLSYKSDSVIFIIIFSLAPFFNSMASLTKEKIEYIQNKPEGL